MRYGFNKTPEFYFGIEEEFQLYDKEFLKPINADKILSIPNVKSELLKNMIEINAGPCRDKEDAIE